MAKLTQDYGYTSLKDKFQNLEIPDGWEVVPVGSKDYKSYKCISNVSLKENLINIKNWDASVVVGQIITSGYPVTIRKIRAKKQNNKYPTKINWGGKDYIARDGYYFLKVGDKLILGDGFMGINNSFYEYNKIITKKDYFVENDDFYPSVRLIPVPATKIVDNPAKVDKVEVVKPIIQDLNVVPAGFVRIKPGEIIPAGSYYSWNHKNKTNRENLNNWEKAIHCIGEIRSNNDNEAIYIGPAPVVPPSHKYEYKPITDINVGDIFVCPKYFHNTILIVQSDCDTRYSISGRNGLNNYSNCQNQTKEEVIKYLNTHKKVFVTNINDKIKKSLEMAAEMVKNSK